MQLITTWFGTFLFEDGEIVGKILFPAEAGEIALRMRAIENGEILAEEEELASSGFGGGAGEQIIVCEERLEALGEVMIGEVPFISPEEHGFDGRLLNRAMLEVGKEKVRTGTSPDEQILQAIRAIDDLSKTANLLSERLHEWHEINFPELPRLVSEEKFIKLVAEFGDRETMLDRADVDITDSVGADISESDAGALKTMAEALQKAHSARRELERFVHGRMEEVAPNMNHIVGPLIGARLISLAGGLERLARMPSSTVQILGAEKAFFKHMKDKVKPPKHGIIFQHPAIHRAPYWQRGNVSRALAAKISLAAKVDFYGSDFIGEKLAADFEKKLAEIRKKYPKPPKDRK